MIITSEVTKQLILQELTVPMEEQGTGGEVPGQMLQDKL